MISKAQQDIIDKMGSGWELGESSGEYDYYGRIQKGGLGRGGKAIIVSSATIRALWKKKLIQVRIDRYPTRVFELVP